MANSVETGMLKPVASTDTFVVSTSAVENWLQGKINATAALAKAKGEEHIPPVNVTLFTLKSSAKFCPFVCVLPEEALKKNRGGRGNDEELSIFNPSDSQGTSKFLPHVWLAVRSFMYNKDDKGAFRSSDLRRDLGLTSQAVNYLTTVMFPRTETKAGSKITMMLMDPLRIFYAMVKEAEEAKGGRIGDFVIEILKTEHNQGTDFTYTFNKVPKSSNKKGKKELAREVERMMGRAIQRGSR